MLSENAEKHTRGAKFPHEEKILRKNKNFIIQLRNFSV